MVITGKYQNFIMSGQIYISKMKEDPAGQLLQQFNILFIEGKYEHFAEKI